LCGKGMATRFAERKYASSSSRPGHSSCTYSRDTSKGIASPRRGPIDDEWRSRARICKISCLDCCVASRQHNKSKMGTTNRKLQRGHPRKGGAKRLEIDSPPSLHHLHSICTRSWA